MNFFCMGKRWGKRHMKIMKNKFSIYREKNHGMVNFNWSMKIKCVMIHFDWLIKKKWVMIQFDWMIKKH
jgi:hypothetical protein